MRNGVIVGAMVMLASLGGASAASAASDVPDDVAALFRCEVVSAQTALGDAVCFSSTISTPHAVYTWTDAFRLGEATESVLQQPNDWIAATTNVAGEPTGTVIASNWNGPAEIVGSSDDAALAATLLAIGDGQLVEDAPAGAWYLIDAGTIVPLNDWARRIVPERMPLADTQHLIAENEAARLDAWNEAQPFGLDQGAFTSLVAIAVLAFGGLLLGVVVTRTTGRGQSKNSGMLT